MLSIFFVQREFENDTGKNLGNEASAGSPTDSVPVAGTVMIPKNLISGTEFTRIDFGCH